MATPQASGARVLALLGEVIEPCGVPREQMSDTGTYLHAGLYGQPAIKALSRAARSKLTVPTLKP